MRRVSSWNQDKISAEQKCAAKLENIKALFVLD